MKLTLKFHCTFIICAAVAVAGCTSRTEATDKLDQTKARVGISATTYPSTVARNATFVVSTAVTNTGDLTLPSMGKGNTPQFRVGVSYHWRRTDEKVIVWDGAISPLKGDLKRGATQAIDLTVKAPATQGMYFLDIDVLQGGAFWFGGVGSQFARIAINVK